MTSPTASGNTVQTQTGVQTPTPEAWYDEPVDGLADLLEEIRDADGLTDWTRLLTDHLTWGNTKIADHVAIYNLNSAKDCPNIETEHCQVDAEDCYARKMEKAYGSPLDYRRRQEVLWDHLDADTFVEAFLDHVRNKVTHPRGCVHSLGDVDLRFNQAGDARHRGDVVKMERIARQLAEYGIEAYTYSASSYLDWDDAETLTVNQSNNFDDYGDRHFTAIPEGVDSSTVEWLDDQAVQCPYDRDDGSIQCGDCRLCLNDDGPDVYVRLH